MHAYRVKVAPAAQEIEVELTIDAVAGSVLLQVPSWVPGAYAFMKFGRDLFDFTAEDGRGAPLAVVREGWNGWRIATTGKLVVRYRAVAADPGVWSELSGIVRHNQALLLGTRYVKAAGYDGPCRVDYELPAGWRVHHPAGGRKVSDTAWEYPSFAVLLDSPFIAGAFDHAARALHGATFHFVFLDRAVGFDDESGALIEAFMKVAEGCHAIFGSFPFEQYTFVCTFDPRAHWGLEHANATLIGLGEVAFVDPDARIAAVRVAGHELVHAWNVCRLKPAALTRLDLSAGSFPDGLWLSEGFTRYYELLLAVRTGALSPGRFVSNIGRYYRHLTAAPAYRRATAIDSSLGTFTNHNRFPGSINATIDYYDKGMLIAFDMDAHLRAKDPPSTLDHAFREFYDAFAAGGFTHDDARRFFDARGLGALFAREVEGTGGLSTPERLKDLGFEPTFVKVAQLGIVLREGRGPSVSNVVDDGPSAEAGVAVDDELLELDGFPFHLRSLAYLIARERPIDIAVRRGHTRLAFRIAPREVEVLSHLTWRGGERELERMRDWLGRPDATFANGAVVPLDYYDNFHGVETVI